MNWGMFAPTQVNKWLLPTLFHSQSLCTFSITGFLKYCIVLKNSIDVVWSKELKHTCMEWNWKHLWWGWQMAVKKEDDKSRVHGECKNIYKKVCTTGKMSKNMRATVMARWITASILYCNYKLVASINQISNFQLWIKHSGLALAKNRQAIKWLDTVIKWWKSISIEKTVESELPRCGIGFQINQWITDESGDCHPINEHNQHQNPKIAIYVYSGSTKLIDLGICLMVKSTPWCGQLFLGLTRHTTQVFLMMPHEWWCWYHFSCLRSDQGIISMPSPELGEGSSGW